MGYGPSLVKGGSCLLFGSIALVGLASSTGVTTVSSPLVLAGAASKSLPLNICRKPVRLCRHKVGLLAPSHDCVVGDVEKIVV